MSSPDHPPGQAVPSARPVKRTHLPWRVGLWHALMLLLGWALFLLGWWRVSTRPWDSADLKLLFVGSMLVFPVMTVAWVLHNVGIHRRKGPRRAVPPVNQVYEADFLGREVQADWPALQQAREVTILVEGDTKRFLAGPPPLTESA
ncbi:MAG: hypothetical protein ACOVQT_04065 [Rubrivivax sp.]